MDFDGDKLDVVEAMVNILKQDEDVMAIDVAISSKRVDTPAGRHLYALLKEPKNFLSLYNNIPYGSCEGFCKLVVRKGEIVIRVSERFTNGKPDPKTKIEWEYGYTRIRKNEWMKFTSGQLIAPLISVGVPSYEKIKKGSRTLKLRG